MAGEGGLGLETAIGAKALFDQVWPLRESLQLLLENIKRRSSLRMNGDGTSKA